MADIDLAILADIESSGNPLALNEHSGAMGLYQIMPKGKKGALDEWNQYHPKEQYRDDDLYDKDINTKIASWYIGERIPKMLKYFKHPDTLENRLTAYNAGISRVGCEIPKETQDYINKYKTRQMNRWNIE